MKNGYQLERILKAMYGTTEDAELARRLRIKVEVIQKAAQCLCLGKDKAVFTGSKMPRWDEVDLAYLADHYADSDNLTLAMELERTVKSVVARAQKMGLRKSRERLQEMGRVNVSIRYGRLYTGPLKIR